MADKSWQEIGADFISEHPEIFGDADDDDTRLTATESCWLDDTERKVAALLHTCHVAACN